MEKECLAAVKDGRLSEEDINRSAERVLRVVFRAAETLGTATAATPDMTNRHHSLRVLPRRKARSS